MAKSQTSKKDEWKGKKKEKFFSGCYKAEDTVDSYQVTHHNCVWCLHVCIYKQALCICVCRFKGKKKLISIYLCIYRSIYLICLNTVRKNLQSLPRLSLRNLSSEYPLPICEQLDLNLKWVYVGKYKLWLRWEFLKWNSIKVWNRK